MSNIKGMLHIAYEGIKRRKIRSFLTILAIAIGISAVLSLISVGESLNNMLNLEYEQLGAEIMIITPGAATDMSFGALSTAKLTKDDLKLISRIEGIIFISGTSYRVARMGYNDKLKYNFVIGLEAENFKETMEKGFRISTAEGRYPRAGESNKAVVGYLLAYDENNIFGKKVDIGSKIKIENEVFHVVGIMERIGNPQDDSQAYITMTDFNRIYGVTEDKYDIIFATAKKGTNLTNLVELVNEKLRKYRDLEKGEEDFNIQTYQQIMESFNSVFGIVGIVLTGIASISLIVGGVGIANTMFTSVLERTREIGTMKAVGATDKDILFVFLLESGVFGLVGGIMGILTGYLLSWSICNIATSYLGVDLLFTQLPGLSVSLLIASIIFGMISGYFPARRASKMNISEALRYE